MHCVECGLVISLQEKVEFGVGGVTNETFKCMVSENSENTNAYVDYKLGLKILWVIIMSPSFGLLAERLQRYLRKTTDSGK